MEDVSFCSYCGQIGGDRAQRVCGSCGLGVRLHADERALRSPGAAFLIVHEDGRISALSAAAERDFGQVVGQPLDRVLKSPDIGDAVALAATGQGDVVTLPVVPLGGRRFRGRLHAIVAPCGDPPAALVVLERA